MPAVIAFPRADYDRAFDAALEGARTDGLQPVVVDRALGVIETAPRTAGSFVEPWRTDNAGVEDTLAHTVNFERRRARIEFVPQGFVPPFHLQRTPVLPLQVVRVVELPRRGRHQHAAEGVLAVFFKALEP